MGSNSSVFSFSFLEGKTISFYERQEGGNKSLKIKTGFVMLCFYALKAIDFTYIFYM